MKNFKISKLNRWITIQIQELKNVIIIKNKKSEIRKHIIEKSESLKMLKLECETSKSRNIKKSRNRIIEKSRNSGLEKLKNLIIGKF